MVRPRRAYRPAQEGGRAGRSSGSVTPLSPEAPGAAPKRAGPKRLFFARWAVPGSIQRRLPWAGPGGLGDLKLSG